MGDRNLYGQNKFSPRKHVQSVWFHRESDSIHDGEYRRHGNATQNCNFTKLFGLDQPALVPTTVERSGPLRGGPDHGLVQTTLRWCGPAGGPDRSGVGIPVRGPDQNRGGVDLPVGPDRSNLGQTASPGSQPHPSNSHLRGRATSDDVMYVGLCP